MTRLTRLFPRSAERIELEPWLPAARRGERTALEQFFRAYQPSVYALCCRMLGRTDDAEDATQAAFVLALRALPRFRGESSLKTWLYRIAVNECLTQLRRKTNAPLPLDERFAIADGAGRTVDRLAAQAALARLRMDHRTVLVLRYWEELDCEEIAAVLDISLSATKMRLKRARDEFEKHYRGEF